MRPIRAVCLGTATALVTLLACTPVAAAATTDADAHDKGKERVITLIGRLAEQTRFPVNPGGAAAQGDRTAFRSNLFDEAGNQVGETGGTCTTTRVDNGGAEQCVVTYTSRAASFPCRGWSSAIWSRARPLVRQRNHRRHRGIRPGSRLGPRRHDRHGHAALHDPPQALTGPVPAR